MKKALISALLATVLAVPSVADVLDNTDVQAAIKLAKAWINNQMAYDSVPGVSVAVVSDQEVVWSQGFGYARLKGKVKATADTTYSICSVSKLFTSIGVLQQRDAGNLSLDAPLSDLLSWYSLPAHETAEEPVTLRNILSHVAGLPREAVTPYWTEIDFPSREEIRAGLKGQAAYYRPYERFQYSNLGLSLAGEAVAAASGQDYHSYIKQSILDPLGMASTTSELPVKEYGKSFAVGYKLKDARGKRKEVAPYTTNGIAPAAGFASSVSDLAKFASWQFRLRENGGTEVLKATTLREMQRIHWTTPDEPGAVWGLGFAMSKVDGKTFIGHGGYCPGYRTSFLTRPEDKLAVIAMVNVNDVSPSTYVRGITGIVSSAIKKANKDESDTDTGEEKADYTAYEGIFGRMDFPQKVAFAATEEGLKSLYLYSSEPGKAVTKLKAEGDHIFRVMSKSGKKLHTVRFEMDEDGKAIRVWQHGQYMDRLE